MAKKKSGKKRAARKSKPAARKPAAKRKSTTPHPITVPGAWPFPMGGKP